jgi:LuxR family transcriptional regulator, maltose regulon positive regulatory protein
MVTWAEDRPAEVRPALRRFGFLRTSGRVSPGERSRSLVAQHSGVRRLWDGDLEGAHALLRQSLTVSTADALGGLALIEALCGRPRPAAEFAAGAGGSTLGEAARVLGRWLSGETYQPRAAKATAEPAEALLTVLTARARLSTADTCGARDLLAEVGGSTALVRVLHRTALAELLIAEKRPAAALAELDDVPTKCAKALTGHVRAVAGWAYLAASEPARALREAREVRRLGPAAGSWAQIDACLVEALAADRLGHEGVVDLALSEALSEALSATVGVVRPFFDAGKPLARLLGARPDLVVGGPLAATIDGHPPTAATAEPITDREGTILRFLPSLLTTMDIARELSVSPNTVKTHVRNIYRKLDVGTRRDAVKRARELGLLRLT